MGSSYNQFTVATPKTVSFYTLGCKLNYSETSSIGRLFENAGYQVVNFDDGSDIVVINTCSVTDFADRKCRKIVRKALRNSPNAFVVMVGCYAQLKPEEISNIEGVDLVLGAAQKFKILDYIDNLSKAPDKGLVYAGDVREAKNFVHAFSFGDRTRSFLKIQDGCSYKCSFCTIPQARGKSRSDTVLNVVNNARQIAKIGIREIVLTGVNIGDFGNGTAVIEEGKPQKEALFIDLIKELDQIEGIDRFRISSIEPNLLTNEIIDFVSQSNRFVPHFHVPLQSANNKQLKMMRRRYKRELYANRVATIRQCMPSACIGADVIVGFPGETYEDFLETYRFLTELDISYLHVFTYSERANTPATALPGAVPLRERRERNRMLGILSEKKRQHFYEKHLGEKRLALMEAKNQNGQMFGFTDNYIKISLPYNPGLINKLVWVELKKIRAERELVVQTELLNHELVAHSRADELDF